MFIFSEIKSYEYDVWKNSRCEFACRKFDRETEIENDSEKKNRIYVIDAKWKYTIIVHM